MAARYKQPSKLNVVSILMGLIVVAVVYGGWKYGPPYNRARNVSGFLRDMKRDAGRFIVGTNDPRETALMRNLREKVLGAGVDATTLRIYFSNEGRTLNVQFSELVTHPFGKSVELKFHRKESIVPVGR